MDNTGNTGSKSGVGWIVVALIVGLIGYFIGINKPSKSKGDGSVGMLASNPCNGLGTSASHTVSLNEDSQPCFDMTLDTTKQESATWVAPSGYHPWVVFKDSTLPTPVVTGGVASWVAPTGTPNPTPAAYNVNIVPTQTRLPLRYTPGTPTPTPGLYGRIIIKP